MENVPLRIRAMMKACKISAPKLAERSGLPLPSIKSILHGQSSNPRKRTLQALANAFNCQTSEFNKDPEEPIEARWDLYIEQPTIGSLVEEGLVKSSIQTIHELAQEENIDLIGHDDMRQVYVDKLVRFAIEEGVRLNQEPKIDRVYAKWLIKNG